MIYLIKCKKKLLGISTLTYPEITDSTTRESKIPPFCSNTRRISLSSRQQLFYCTTFVLRVPTVHGNSSCTCFVPRHSPYSNYLCRAPDIEAIKTIFNVFSYDALLSRDFEPVAFPDDERMRYVLGYGRV